MPRIWGACMVRIHEAADPVQMRCIFCPICTMTCAYHREHDPEVHRGTRDIVLWSGLTLDEQRGFNPTRDRQKRPIVLANTWISLVLDDRSLKLHNFEDESCEHTTRQGACVDGCGYHRADSNAPWEGVSRIIARSVGQAGYNARTNDPVAYLLLKKFSPTSVFSRVELPALVQQFYRLNAEVSSWKTRSVGEAIEAYKRGTRQIKALDIRIHRDAGVVSIGGPDSPSEGPLTCELVMGYVRNAEEVVRQNFRHEGEEIGHRLRGSLCLHCYEKCQSDFERCGAKTSSGCSKIFRHHVHKVISSIRGKRLMHIRATSARGTLTPSI